MTTRRWSYCSDDELMQRISLVTLDTIGEIMGTQRKDEEKIANIEGVRALCEYLIEHIRNDLAEDLANDKG